MKDLTDIFILFLTAGIVLIAIEVFIPGWLIGIIGALSLICAGVIAFLAFGFQEGLIAAISIIILLVIVLILWIMFFPKTKIGKALTLESTGSNFKITEKAIDSLLNKDGVAITDLRPSGIAKIDGQRVDVTTDGRWINKNTAIKVIQIEGTNIIVRAI